ncbi:MAG: FHA domain-containing protein [Aggregatilineales bacterium]
MMITCNRCKFAENRDDARYCARCGAPLSATSPRPTQHLLVPRATNRLTARSKHIGQLGPNEMAVYVADYEDPLIVSVTHETILGRVNRVPSLTPQPAIDLTPFQAVERGVSRAHAALRRYEDGVAVVDLDSTNGTWVNTNRLPPQTPVLLQNGDRVLLAKLTLYVYLT